jgi:hypothetical protein
MNIGSKTLLQTVVGVAVAAWLPVALAGEITLYHQRDFQGESLSLNRQATDLEKTGFYDGASSIVVRSGVWEACSAAFFDGACVRLSPGEYSQLDASLDNRIISVREFANASAATPATIGAVAQAEPRIALYEAPGFGGRAIELTRTAGNLERISFYTGTQAVIVYSGTWRLCSSDYYRGDCKDFSPGRYANLGGFGDHVASAELIATTPGPVGLVAPPPPSGRVVLYELPRFEGRSLVIDQRQLPNMESLGFDAASMRIEGGYWMFCTDVLFQGDCRTLGPGEYARLPRDVDRRIASARRVDDVYGAAGTTP